MLTSINQVNREFFKLFDNLEIQYEDGSIFIPKYRYAKKSSYDYSEEDCEPVYPCIAMQDYVPTPNNKWYIDLRRYFDGAVTADKLKGYLTSKPIYLEFRYDVSIAAKGYLEHTAMRDYFLKHFVYGERFIFDQHLSGEDLVGDIVPYEVFVTDISRTDGIFETNYEFRLSAWLHVKDPEEVDLVKKIVVNCQPMMPQ